MTRPLCCALVLSCLALSPRPSHAWCAWGPTWDVSSSRVIQVYLSNYGSESIANLIDPSWGASIYTLERYVKVALDSWNEDGQGRVRFNYAGFWNAADDDNENNPKVIIRADGDGWPGGNCGFADACAFRSHCDGNGCKNGHVAMKKYGYLGGGGKVWRTLVIGTPFNDFLGTLIHELGHVLGLNHPGECQGQESYKGVMACATGCAASLEARYLRKDDVLGQRERYTWKNSVTEFKKSSDALSWSTGTPTMPNYYPDLRMSTVSTNQYVDDQFFMAFPYSSNAHFAKYDYSAGWSSRASIEWNTNGNTWKNVAIAIDKYATNYVAAAWLSQESETQDNQKIRWAYSQNEGANWSYGYFQAGGVDRTTRRNGVTSAWDPQTSTWVFGWLDDNNHLAFQTLRQGASPGPTSTSELSIDAPGIACSAVQGTLPYNCVVTFGSSGVIGPCLMYAFGKVNGSYLFELSGTVYSDCWYQYQTPYVTADYQNSSYPYTLSFRQAGPDNYTFRKNATPSSGWQDQRSFTVTPSVLTASIGLYVRSGVKEFWDVYVKDADN